MIIIDQIGRQLNIAEKPLKIVSLVPSLTELLCDFGIASNLVGITKFCTHPKKILKVIPKIGGTKTPNTSLIQQLNPDLVIANKEENKQKHINALSSFTNVYVSDIKNLDDASRCILDIGKMIHDEVSAKSITESIKTQFESLNPPKSPLKVCYLIWQNPLMTIGGDTFISHMLEKAGFENVFRDQERYPEITFEKIKEKSPDLVFLSSEPFPFRKKHQERIFKSCEIENCLVDGRMFSWYGTAIISAGSYFHKLRYSFYD